jgi:hypothetical protein
MLFFGWDRKVKIIGSGPVIRCPNCDNQTHWSLMEIYRYVSIFFVPPIRCGHSYVMMCPVFSRGADVGSPQSRALLRSV